jgi:hypothetical protein
VLLATRQSNGSFPKPIPFLLLSALVRSVLHCLALFSLTFLGFLRIAFVVYVVTFLPKNSGAGLASGFMAYSSSTNPFFMLAKDKRSIGDAGNTTPPRTLPTIAHIFSFFRDDLFEVYTKYDLPEKKPLTNSPSHGHH